MLSIREMKLLRAIGNGCATFSVLWYEFGASEWMNKGALSRRIESFIKRGLVQRTYPEILSLTSNGQRVINQNS